MGALYEEAAWIGEPYAVEKLEGVGLEYEDVNVAEAGGRL